MNKNIFLALILLVFLSSCDMMGSTDQGSSGRTQSRITGDGISVSFVRGVPPDRIYVDTSRAGETPFEVVVDISNTGSFPRDDLASVKGKLYLTGFDPNIIRGGRWDDGTNEFNRIQGATQSFPNGGFMQKNYVASIHYPSSSREYPIDLMLTSCYYYETLATGMVCVDPNPGSIDEKVCRMGSVSLDAQNAPVKVTSVEQTGNSRELILTINIANRGSGTILREFSSGGVVSENRCLNTGFGDTDLIAINARISGLGEGACRPKGTESEPIRIVNGQGTVICKFNLPQNIDSAYATQMELNLEYGYRKSTRKRVTLVNTAPN